MAKEIHTKVKTHKVRSFFSAVLALLGIYLIISSIGFIWLDQTLTNTNTYVATVSPLITKPAVQTYISQEVTTAILKNSPTQDLASSLLPQTTDVTNLSTQQLQDLLRPVIESDITGIIQSQSFATLWQNTNQTAHASLVNQLNGGSGAINLDLSPAVTGLINDLNNSKLSALAVHIKVTPDTGKLTIKNKNISVVHQYFGLYKASAYLILVIAIAVLGLSVYLSSKRRRLVFRILLWTGIVALLEAVVLMIPYYVTLKGTNQVTENAAKAVIEAVFKNLLVADLIIGTVCVLAGVIGMVYSHLKLKKK